jgi:hypothetical protein
VFYTKSAILPTLSRHRVTAYPVAACIGPQYGIEKYQNALYSSTCFCQLCLDDLPQMFSELRSFNSCHLTSSSGRTGFKRLGHYLIENNIQNPTFRRLLVSQFLNKNEDETYWRRQNILPKRLSLHGCVLIRHWAKVNYNGIIK